MSPSVSATQVSRADFCGDPYLYQFGVSVSTKMVEVEGRVIDAPKIQYGGRVSQSLSIFLFTFFYSYTIQAQEGFCGK